MNASALEAVLARLTTRPADLRNLPTIVFPAPLTSTIEELGGFLTRERSASVPTVRLAGETEPARNGAAVTADSR